MVVEISEKNSIIFCHSMKFIEKLLLLGTLKD
jgi:hypothetical protein